jgi:predicted ATPase
VIREVRLQNYRCFRNATVKLGPLTALVGPNASGKTALLTAITSGISKRTDVRYHQTGGSASLVWAYEQGEETQRLQANAGTRGRPTHRAQYLHLDVREMRQPRQVKQQGQLETNGSNLVNVIATLGRKTQDALARQLSALVPVLQDIDARPGDPGHHRLVFQDRWNERVWYEPHEVSDGTFLTLGLLTAQHQDPPPDVIAIEEPEHGLHPYLLHEIVDVLRKLASGDVGGRAIQIVLATQSAELLELLEPSEVRFLTRDSATGEVSIEEPAIETANWREAYEAHQRSLSSLWLSGGAGGVPGE